MTSNSTSAFNEYFHVEQFVALCLIASIILVLGAFCQLALCMRIKESYCARR